MNLPKAAKIGLGWTFITVVGVYSFIWAKNSIDRKRYDNMKIRERMRKSNYGEYSESADRRFDA